MKTAYLDIETRYEGTFTDQRLFKDYKHHRITVIGVRVLDGECDAFIQLLGNDVTKANLMLVLKGVERLVTYNGRSIPDKVKKYTGFDFPVIAAQLGVVLDQEFPHVDLCPECWSKGLWGGQKTVEQSLRLQRKLPGKDGKWADEMWKQYETTRDERIKQEVLAYNQEDVMMLRRIEEALQQR
jgi:uncharacterized protein YprB with RNaseH-like and TPR domain